MISTCPSHQLRRTPGRSSIVRDGPVPVVPARMGTWSTDLKRTHMDKCTCSSPPCGPVPTRELRLSLTLVVRDPRTSLGHQGRSGTTVPGSTDLIRTHTDKDEYPPPPCEPVPTSFRLSLVQYSVFTVLYSNSTHHINPGNQLKYSSTPCIQVTSYTTTTCSFRKRYH